jgi:hypothetical protein
MFGVEMEISRYNRLSQRIDGEVIKEAMRNARVPRINRRAPGYYHSDGTTWDVKTDSSCGWEIASPKLTLDERDENESLDRACLALNAAGAVCDNSTGLHAHIDVSDFNWRDMQRLIALWVRYEPFFFEVTPPSRRGNAYCLPLRRSSWSGRDGTAWPHTGVILSAATEEAFRNSLSLVPRGAMNVQHYIRSGRVEFRLQGGSIDYRKIRNWVLLLLSVVNRAKHPVAPPVSCVINQPRMQLGFGTRYVFQVLGLAPNSWAPEVAQPLCGVLEQWVSDRRRAFAVTDMSVCF